MPQTPRPMHHSIGACASSRGFSLLEVLIALIVLAIGLLGLAALQNFGLRFGNQSYQRSQATALIYDMIDRMRANPDGTLSGSYLQPLTSTPPAVVANCIASPCTSSSDMAVFDRNQWITQITLPQVLGATAEGMITPGAVLSPTSGLYTITVQWQESNVTMKQEVTVQLP